MSAIPSRYNVPVAQGQKRAYVLCGRHPEMQIWAEVIRVDGDWVHYRKYPYIGWFAWFASQKEDLHIDTFMQYYPSLLEGWK